MRSPLPDSNHTGVQSLASAGSDFNAMDFIARQAVSKLATTTLVLVKAVTNAGVSAVGFVDVQPMVAQIDGRGQPTAHGTIHNVPYMRLQGGARAVILDPVVGDIGIAVFGSRDLSAVKANRAPSNPGSRRQFDMADALYLGGVLNGVPTEYVRFFSGGVEIVSASEIRLRAPTITLDGAVAGTGAAVFQDSVTGAGIVLDTHVHIGHAPGTPTDPPTP